MITAPLSSTVQKWMAGTTLESSSGRTGDWHFFPKKLTAWNPIFGGFGSDDVTLQIGTFLDSMIFHVGFLESKAAVLFSNSTQNDMDKALVWQFILLPLSGRYGTNVFTTLSGQHSNLEFRKEKRFEFPLSPLKLKLRQLRDCQALSNIKHHLVGGFNPFEKY